MKQILKKLLDRKEILLKVQKRFIKTLKNLYPCLLTEDISDFKKLLKDEIQFLLSSCVKFKSRRIEIEISEKKFSQPIVILTRNPGLKSPRSSYEDFGILETGSIDKDGNLLRAGENNKKVMLETLKKSPQIDQEKLKVFYEFLREGLVWRKRYEKIIAPAHHYQEYKENLIKVKEHSIVILSIGFVLKLLRPKGQRKYERFDNIRSETIQDYNLSDYDILDSGVEHQYTLREFLRNYKDFEIALKRIEKEKVILVKQVKDQIERLKEFNKPFRLLNQLLKT